MWDNDVLDLRDTNMYAINYTGAESLVERDLAPR